MIPIGDTNVRARSPAIVTIGLIIINVIVFLFQITMSLPELESFFMEWAVQPAEIVRGEQLYTLITSMFLHGGWLHLISNMLFLWVFGDNIEHIMGRVLYLLFYLGGGIVASIAQILTNPASTIPNVGASGAIAAILGAYVVMFPRSMVRTLVFLGFFVTVTRISALFFLGFWFITQLFSGFASLGVPTEQTAGIAFFAHIGGFVFGLIAGFLFRGRARSAALVDERPFRY